MVKNENKKLKNKYQDRLKSKAESCFVSNKSGYTLMEILVSMLIISLFFLATTKVLTMKQKTEFQLNPHGYYECYKTMENGGEILKAHRVDGNETTDAYTVDKCFLTTPRGATFANIHYIGPKSGVGGNWADNSDWFYYNTQEPIFNEDMDFASPSDYLAKIVEVGVNPIGEEVADQENIDEIWKREKEEFWSYLQTGHPDSKILELWQSLDANPPEALLIAW